jgi:hypothetical protein
MENFRGRNLYRFCPLDNRFLTHLNELFQSVDHKDKNLSSMYPLVSKLYSIAVIQPLSTIKNYEKGQYSYFQLLNIKNVFQHYIFSSLHQIQCIYMTHCLYIFYLQPLSTAEVERIFSQVALIKTSHRANIKTETLSKILNMRTKSV